MVRVGSGFSGRSRIGLQRRWLILMMWRWRGLGSTWTCLRGCWHGVITSSGDVRWHQQQCFGMWQGCVMFTSTWRRSQKSRWRMKARATSVESHISSVGRSVVDMGDRTARVANGWATHEEIVAVHGKDLAT